MALSGFTKYDINSISPTMIAQWDSAPATLLLRRVFGIKGAPNANMWRGDAVETGVEVLARGGSLEAAIEQAKDTFLHRCEGVLDEDSEAALALLPGMVEQGAEALAEGNYGEILGSQLVVEKSFNEVGVPGWGKMDFAFFGGRNIELKTTTRCPSKVESASTSHRWQAAFYAEARQEPVDLVYLTAKKHAVFTVHPGDPILASMLRTAAAMERMLASHDEGGDLIASLPSAVDSFYWDDDLIQAYTGALSGDLPPLKGTGTEALHLKGIITFGKHAGRHISDVPPKYLEWLLNPRLSDGTKFDVPADLQTAIQNHQKEAA